MYIDAVISGNLKTNVSKSAVMVFSRNSVEDGWKWAEHKLPKVSSCTFVGIGIDFVCNGARDVHLRVLDNGGKNELHSIISNGDISLSARRLLLLSMVVRFGKVIRIRLMLWSPNLVMKQLEGTWA